ncbi:rod shape-determining protein MreD [Fictibacillus barbaricus]|uniref:Rod shape-determining protein MreD n=1 Tax=Fictibacillus barbaricus TaxID=182136 RepID=A0ABU1U2G2_9BACL|nr:rod shape-determining protein MreD [Fictibacillus barbaricus]MDR7073658.1 rod shape-determining protein MreD [Fictibacillus barbaricus]
MMKKILLPFLIYLAFISESSLVQAFLPQDASMDWQIIPRFSMVMILFIAMYLNTTYGLLYGLGFGLLTDLLYTDIIGVYLFSMAATAYITSVFSRYLFGNLIVTIFLSIIGVSILEFFVYGLNSLIGISNQSIDLFLYKRLLPTLILNGLFAILIYYPYVKYLNRIKETIKEN